MGSEAKLTGKLKFNLTTIIFGSCFGTLWQASGDTVFENHRKRLIQHCERSELHLNFE